MSNEALFEGESDGYREEFLFAVETARALHDPASDWAGFRDTLWAHLMRVFGVDDPGDWPDDLPRPGDGPGMLAPWLPGCARATRAVSVRQPRLGRDLAGDTGRSCC